MSRSWTGGGLALPGHRPASSRVPLLAAALCALILLPSCRGDEGGANQILPIHATIDLPDPEPAGPAVFFRQSAADTVLDDDLIILEVILRTSGSLQFDAFTLEIRFDPGVVQVACNPLDPTRTCPDPPFSSTPFVLPCNSCVRNCVHACPTPPCTPPDLCQPCDEVCSPPDTVESVAQNPLCLVNGAEANATGTLVMGVSINKSSDCASSFTVPAGSDLKLVTLGFVASSTGTSDIELIRNANPLPDGDCEILMDLGDLGVPCDDRSATITATR